MPGSRIRDVKRRRLWVFYTPLHRDVLVWASVALFGIYTVLHRDDLSDVSLGSVTALLGALAASFLGVGSILGTIREYWLARR